MSRSLTVRKPRRSEMRRLHSALEQELTARQRRRTEVLVLYGAGLEAVDMARTLEVHVNTVYSDLKAFDQEGVQCIDHPLQGGAPVRISEAQRSAIVRLAQTPPGEVGLPYGRWSLSKLRHYVLQQRIVRAISREYLRQVLKKGGSAFAISNAN